MAEDIRNTIQTTGIQAFEKKYENPDVSKDLNIQWINCWNNTSSTINMYGHLNWNTPLNKNLIYHNRKNRHTPNLIKTMNAFRSKFN